MRSILLHSGLHLRSWRVSPFLILNRTTQQPTSVRAAGIVSMEYGEAIAASSAEKAYSIARERLAGGSRDLRAVAAEAVGEAYCVCVVEGEDAAEGCTSAIHADLIDAIEVRLRAAGDEQEIG
jgi:hypothetical protein